MKLHSRPVRFLVTRLARAYGFLDPIAVLTRLRGFSQQSEVGEPIELLRAGMLFHARGLVNTKAIQNNLDWVWPYWVERQFNPNDPSFIPRAFSFSHINLTHRNWTAAGQPDVPYYPIVDPRGLVTPLFDGWSLDFWIVPTGASPVFPSKLARFEQELLAEAGNMRVRSRIADPAFELVSETELIVEDGVPYCVVRISSSRLPAGMVAVALRPYNPEGISALHEVEMLPGGNGWRIEKRHEVVWDRAPLRQLFSTYHDGDVSLRLDEKMNFTSVHCPAGMATAAVLFSADSMLAQPLALRVPIYDELHPKRRVHVPALTKNDTLAKLTLPVPALQRLYDLALASVVLHAPEEVYPGPYTYKRFWFRDAVYILHALLTVGGVERTRRALGQFHPRQRHDGYFLSQEGEWDSNGEALWMYERFAALTGESLPEPWLDAVRKGARWITRKRLPRNTGRPEAGLLPAGFSAEHLGPNDFYYWDDFWAIGGLQAAAILWNDRDAEFARACRQEMTEFMATVEGSIPAGPQRRYPGAIPASPYRRMDSGAIGSIVADYPLRLFPPGDERMRRTAEFLCTRCFQRGVFFQDMIHSGLNIYLTIQLAQVWLRAGEPERVWSLVQRIAELASPTGQWPEAIHPHTLGGCMGDGQHIWAAAEWLLLIRNLFIREEGDGLILGSGLAREWLAAGELALEPTLTPHGPVGVRFAADSTGVNVRLDAQWRRGAPPLEFRVPGCNVLSVTAGELRSEFHLANLP